MGKVSDDRIDPDTFKSMNDALAHRGPDAEGIRFFENGCVALGHRRLSIIDLSDLGIQPMPNEDQTIWVTFNGEIYNYLPLRQELVKKGHVFRSQTDTEVILHAYEEWGMEAVKRFRGIFAFGLWDSVTKRLWLARDQLGVKPLYYYFRDGCLLFASELKATISNPTVPRTIRSDALGDYLSFGYIPEDKSIFEDIWKLPAGYHLTLREGRLNIEQYWDVQYTGQIRNEDEAIEIIRNVLAESVELQLMSDVPVGVFLSGGIDSSAITAYASQAYPHKLQTFTIGFDQESHNETEYAQVIANGFGTEHNEKHLDFSQVSNLISLFARTYDEPFYDSSAIPTYLLSQFSRTRVKVALGGDGGDEVFAGYRWYDRFLATTPASRFHLLWKTADAALSPLLDSLPSSSFSNRVNAYLRKKKRTSLDVYFGLIGFLNTDVKKSLLTSRLIHAIDSDPLWLFRKHWRSDYPAISTLQYLDLKTYLVDDILVKVDRASMAHGLEVRVPLLDHKLVEAAFSISADIIYAGGERKSLFKKALKGIVPDETLSVRKKGFSVPMAAWFEAGLREFAINILQDGALVQHEIIQPQAIQPYLHTQRASNAWLLLVLEMWFRFWMDGNLLDFGSSTKVS